MATEAVVLVIDDDDSYQLLMPRLLERANVALSLHFVEDGDEAIFYLNGHEKYSDRSRFPVPKILLLDLKMRRVNGFDFLSWKQQKPIWDSIPTIVWSSSDLNQDREKAFALGATHYFQKPADNDGLLELLMGLEQLAHGLDSNQKSIRAVTIFDKLKI